MEKEPVGKRFGKRESDVWNEVSHELSAKDDRKAEAYWREVAENGPSTDVAPFVQGTNTGSPKRLHPDRKTGDH
ncbi:hypothetical protein GTO91_02035 [Heliobacterium undosum]|uniref:Uncharacterized protein n=1 Tax=Heliomicrobium undosum TaxID=121734 RepID=A0A845L141_9FIRM|nr:hypothetical protein [Heliomicrobium undosum]MZP28504.1 hypothetical protein [Heliomicrobium undosum]